MPLTTSKTLGKCHCDGKLFFTCIVNFLNGEKSAGNNNLNTTLMRKIAHGWSGFALNGFVADW